MNWKQWLCILWYWGHKEELYRKREDHRVLIWVCPRCDKVTRSLKLKYTDMKRFRNLRIRR